MENILEYKIANNYEEYLLLCIETFVKKTKTTAYSIEKKNIFDTVDEWIQFFGAFELMNEKYDDIEDWEQELLLFEGDINLKPNKEEYPVLVAYNFSDDDDRFGTVSNQLWDWKPLAALNLKISR
ncbi:hypothetical protein [Bacillus sp. Brlt_9]|uniref:hypothetical protein n=1 Tax=Bacillus sp. Brlt_9 TaxID=3110916 RepID=UPI003F7B559C